MKKVTYRERTFLNNYMCIDKPITRYFMCSWVVGGLTYFKTDRYGVFVVATDDIIKIEND